MSAADPTAERCDLSASGQGCGSKTQSCAASIVRETPGKCTVGSVTHYLPELGGLEPQGALASWSLERYVSTSLPNTSNPKSPFTPFTVQRAGRWTVNVSKFLREATQPPLAKETGIHHLFSGNSRTTLDAGFQPSGLHKETNLQATTKTIYHIGSPPESRSLRPKFEF